MMLKSLGWKNFVVVTAALTLVGCSGLSSKSESDAEAVGQLKPVEQQVDPVAPMVLRVVGYGAINPNSKSLSEPQRRLLAIRSSKMDAYRALAERVYGMQVQGSTTVRDMVVQNDNFRSYVETYMHGARVVSADVMADGTVETVLEMVVDNGFRTCLQTSNNQRFNVDCRAPLVGAQMNSQFNQAQQKRVRDESGMPNTGFYFIE